MDTIVFDTETTGLIKARCNDIKKQPYITEIYACRIDENFKLLAEFESLVKPPIPIPEVITNITGISNETLVDAPPFSKIIPDLQDLFLGAKRVVAHNLAFDRDMLANELHRNDHVLRFPWPTEHICTVERSLQIHGHRLSLTKLHQELLGRDFPDSHRAKSDVFALVRCYREMVKKGMI